MSKVLSPTEGGCWYCQTEIDPQENYVYSGEFDANVHVDCLRQSLKSDPQNLDTKVIMSEVAHYVHLFVDDKQGVRYGDSEFLFTKEGYFAMKPANPDVQLQPMLLEIDGVNIPAIGLSEYDLAVADFDMVPINHYGFKTIAISGQDELMVTANGYFIQYSWGLPSIVGLPADIEEVSTVFHPVKFPEFLAPTLLFTQEEYVENLHMLSEASFSGDQVYHYVNISLLTFKEKSDAFEKKVASLAKFYPDTASSKYFSLFPKYTEEQAKIFDGVHSQARHRYQLH